MKSDRNVTQFVAIASGIAYGVILFLLGVMLAGGGHGWGVALIFSVVAVFTTPKLVSVFFKAPDERIYTLPRMLLAFAVIDFLLVAATVGEGIYYFNKVRDGAMLWLVLFSAPQIAAVVRFRRDKYNSSLDTDASRRST